MSHLNKCTFRGDNEDTLHHCTPGVWVINLQLSWEEVALGWLLRALGRGGGGGCFCCWWWGGCGLSKHRPSADSLDSPGWFCHRFREFFSHVLSPNWARSLFFKKGKNQMLQTGSQHLVKFLRIKIVEKYRGAWQFNWTWLNIFWSEILI